MIQRRSRAVPGSAGHGTIHGDIVALQEATGLADDSQYWGIGRLIVKVEKAGRTAGATGKHARLVANQHGYAQPRARAWPAQ